VSTYTDALPMELFYSCRPRTCLDFTSDKEIWWDVERWAEKEDYKLQSHSGTGKMYKKAGSLDTGPYLLIRQDSDKVHVEAWVKMISASEIAIDEATLIGMLYIGQFVPPFNRLLTRLRSPVRIRESCRTRAIWGFTPNKSIWSYIEYWAKKEGYKLKSRSSKERVYKKGGFWVEPDTRRSIVSCILIRQDGDRVHIEAWREIGRFILKKEIATDEPDMLRKECWKDNAKRVNRLLLVLGSPTIIEGLDFIRLVQEENSATSA